MSLENSESQYKENLRAERLQVRREHFYEVLQTVCQDKRYTPKRIAGIDTTDEENWIEFRFIPMRNDENITDYEFHKFVDELVQELDSDEYFITWYEHPGGTQAVKVEIDET